MVDLDLRHTLHGCNLLDNAGAYCPVVEGCRCSWTACTMSLAAGIDCKLKIDIYVFTE